MFAENSFQIDADSMAQFQQIKKIICTEGALEINLFWANESLIWQHQFENWT